MFSYMKVQCRDTLVTIPEACNFLGLTKDELCSKCEQYGVHLYNWDGQWGFPSEHFRQLNNTLYFEQCRDGCDDSGIFADINLQRLKPVQTSKPQTHTLSYIRNIEGLKPTYTVEEAGLLLGIAPDEMEKICDENGLLMIQDYDGTWFVTCYEYLTVNNMLYQKQNAASGEENTCA